MATQLNPYIFFYGRCEEALEFYKGVFGGTYELMRVSESPFAAEMPAEARQRVMHATFTAGAMTFMCSDGQDVKAIDPSAGNISLSLGYDDDSAGERVFNALAAGGKVDMPIDKAFWGGRFGQVTDKFGTEWMMVLP